MHKEYHHRFRSHSMSSETWSSKTSLEALPLHILVTIEHFESNRLYDFLTSLVRARRISRLVVDEAHLALTHDSFRHIMQTLYWLGSMSVQIILLSATAGPSLVEDLFAKFGITQYTVCREPTQRPNISFNVVRSSNCAKTLDQMVREVLGTSLDGKVIVFCRSKEVTEETAKRLGHPYCHGAMTEDEIEEVLKPFRSGQARCVVCTTVLGVCLDLPDILWVFHLDYPYDMMSYIQEAGRAGRTPGIAAWSYVIIPEDQLPKLPNPDRFGAKLIIDWANDKETCRRWLMQLFNDGVAEPCAMLGRVAHLCDVCNARRSTRPDRGAPSTLTTTSIDRYLIARPG